MTLEPRGPQYERVKASLAEAIVDGRFAPGDQIPSLRDLCAHFGVSLATVQREDVMAYLWDVLGNELYRFLAGENSYSRMIERARTKTERFLRRFEVEDACDLEPGTIPT